VFITLPVKNNCAQKLNNSWAQWWTWRDSDYTIMLEIFGLAKCIIFVLRLTLCGGVTSTFSFQAATLPSLCGGYLLPRSRLESLWGVH